MRVQSFGLPVEAALWTLDWGVNTIIIMIKMIMIMIMLAITIIIILWTLDRGVKTMTALRGRPRGTAGAVPRKGRDITHAQRKGRELPKDWVE